MLQQSFDNPSIDLSTPIYTHKSNQRLKHTDDCIVCAEAIAYEQCVCAREGACVSLSLSPPSACCEKDETRSVIAQKQHCLMRCNDRWKSDHRQDSAESRQRAQNSRRHCVKSKAPLPSPLTSRTQSGREGVERLEVRGQWKNTENHAFVPADVIAVFTRSALLCIVLH